MVSASASSLSPSDSGTPGGNTSLSPANHANASGVGALVRKELFQCGILCVASLLGCGLLTWSTTSNWSFQESIPFRGSSQVPYLNVYLPVDPLVANFSAVGGILAVLMGLLQTAWESTTGTWHFLLYRPASRRRVLTVKLLTGGLLLMICTVIPGLTYGVWASVPGTHVSPFNWGMTWPFWQIWLTIPVVYLGAVQSGLCETRWYGTRLMPIVVAVVICFGMVNVPYWWMIGLPTVIAVVVLQLIAIYHTMRVRDFS